MTDRELFAQAAAALKVSAWDHIHAVGKQALIDAIIDRLAQPDAEPVAWAMLRADGLILDVICPDERESYQGEYTVQLYAAPPAAPAPAVPDIVNPITDADIDRIADAVPVDQIGVHITTWHRRFARAVLSATPAVREPLTDEQIDALWRAPMSADWEHREFARAIEAHHGIGGGGNG